MRALIASLSAAIALTMAAPVYAGCALKVLPVAVTMVGQRPTVPVVIGGQTRRFLIDSGSYTDAVSPALASSPFTEAVAEYNDPTVTGANGKKVKLPLVVASEFQFLDNHFKNHIFVVMPGLDGLDGLIGQSLLGQMDIEYDLKDGLIQLVKTEGCKGKEIVYWAKDGQPYSKMSMTRKFYDRHTVGAIYINGQKMLATFDTGAPVSFITEAAAIRAGVKVTDPGVVPVGKGGGIDGQFDAWAGTFAQVQIGDEKIVNAHLEIGRSDAKAFDVLLGADFFQSHHVYVSNDQGKIFFTYEGGLPFKAGASPPPARLLAPPPPPPLAASIASVKLDPNHRPAASCVVKVACSVAQGAVATDKSP